MVESASGKLVLWTDGGRLITVEPSRGPLTGQALYELIRTQNAHYGSLIRAAFGEPFYTLETVRIDDVVTMGVSTF